MRDSLVLGDRFETVGDDDGEITLGAAPRRGAVRVPTPRWMRATTSQGVSRPQEELDVLPFEAATILVGSTTGLLLARPQRPFRGERLVLSAISAGADASALVSIFPAIYIGAVQVGAQQGDMPIAAFAATAFGVRLSFPAAGQGTDCKIFLRLPGGPLKADVVVTGVLFGRAMR